MEKFIELFTETLEVTVEVNKDTKLSSLAEWDSIGALSIVSVIDDKYGVMIHSKFLQEMRTIADLYNFICDNIKNN